MKQAYPTFIVNTDDGSDHPFLVCVPDMDILTEGDSLADAIEMARDAIGLVGISMEDNKEELPIPSDQRTATEKVEQYTEEIDFSKGVLTYVDVDFSEYRREQQCPEEEALKRLLKTMTYELLQDKNSGLFAESPEYVWSMLEDEENGNMESWMRG